MRPGHHGSAQEGGRRGGGGVHQLGVRYLCSPKVPFAIYPYNEI